MEICESPITSMGFRRANLQKKFSVPFDINSTVENRTLFPLKISRVTLDDGRRDYQRVDDELETFSPPRARRHRGVHRHLLM
jgi:hypothetical protein